MNKIVLQFCTFLDMIGEGFIKFSDNELATRQHTQKPGCPTLQVVGIIDALLTLKSCMSGHTKSKRLF